MTQQISIEDRHYLINEPTNIEAVEGKIETILFAHGAGAAMDSDFMNEMTEALTKNGFRVIRFEFPYMQQRRIDGKKRPPNKENICLESWAQAITDWENEASIHIAGKSMGGRMASILASKETYRHLPIKSVRCFGYPFHAPGKTKDGKEKPWRIDHLSKIKVPLTLYQGTRDPFGNQEEINNLQKTNPSWPVDNDLQDIELCWVPDGNHDFKPRIKSGYTHTENINFVAKHLKNHALL